MRITTPRRRIVVRAATVACTASSTWRVLCCVALLLVASPAVRAQCSGEWTDGPFEIPSYHGANSAVTAIVAYDPPGPAPQVLIVGGNFTRIGGISANHIAMWDGSLWHPLGEGTNSGVFTLMVWNDFLYVGGRFTTAGGQPNLRVAAWNGNGWLHVGNGIGENTIFADRVSALAVYDGSLYAAGNFDIAGAFTFVDNIARLNGNSWEPVSGGVPEEVYALQVFDEDGPGAIPPALYAGGDTWHPSFANVRKYVSGGEWTDIGGPDGEVYAMTVTNQGLIVGGSFSTTNGSSFGQGVARWDGEQWWSLNLGVVGTVWALQAFGDGLIAGGHMIFASGVPVENLAVWDGTFWGPFAGGITAPYFQDGPRALGVHQGSLVVGGNFQKTDSAGRNAVNIVRYDGDNWWAYFAPRSVMALTQFRNQVVAGGYFASTGGTTATNAYHLTAWDGSTILPFPGGVNSQVNALEYYISGSGTLTSHNLVVGGEFTQAGGASANRIAVWSEGNFTPGGWSPLGQGFNGPVHALDRFNGRTVAAGAFTASGATPMNCIARWTDVPGPQFSWQPMGPAAGFNAAVRALKSYPVFFQSVQLVAAGDFTFAGGTSASRIATWTESVSQPSNPTWQPMGNGFNDTVYAVERHNGSTYAAGAFTASGGTTVNRIARWDTSLNPDAWVQVGGNTLGGGFNSSVYALLSHGGFLYAMGAFTTADGTPATRLARWDGVTWSAVAGGLDSYGFALAPFQTEIAVGGEFEYAGALESQSVARLLVGAPWAASVTPSAAECGSAFEVSLQLAPGYEQNETSFQWRKDGQPLSDGPTGTGSSISGAHLPTLVINSVSDDDQGVYDCILSNACGSGTSPSVLLAFAEPCSVCPADIVVDAAVDVNDLLAVINGWGSCPAPCPPACAADISPALAGDCAVNVDDLLAVINAWGPCP